VKLNKIIIAVILVVVIIAVVLVVTQLPGDNPSSDYVVGIWNNAEFSKPAEEWSDAAISLGGEDGVIDLVVAQAHDNGLVYLPFPFQNTGFLYSTTTTDLVEMYLSEFEAAGLGVILSVQPLEADIKELIGIILSRYGNHDNILGINIDIEWKESGTPNHVSNEERDTWLSEMKKYNANYRLFITYFQDYTYFPDDHPDLVILFDGEEDTQTNLLRQYEELAKHYGSVGIYTGYSSSTPPVASAEQIISAAPNTKYIIHTYDVFSDRKVVIFQMDDVQVDWLESLSINLTNLHIEKQVPVLCDVIPNNLDNPDVGGGYLPIYLMNVNRDYSDLVEIGLHGYTHNASEMLRGMSYDEQKDILEKGLQIFDSMEITPSTFIPPFGSADNTTVEVAEDLGFQSFSSIYGGLSSSKMLILDNYLSLTTGGGSNVTIKTPEQLISEIDQNEGPEPVMVLYQFFDFQADTENKLLEFADVLDVLKDSGKYVFMTPRQYKATVDKQAALM
jgi:peptidoglycan/xylan/chitin deacetylase (PgdA/CDA1 family)